MHLEFDNKGYVCCILYGCHTENCVEYTGKVPTEPEAYADIDDWAERAYTRAYKLDDAGNLVYDSTKVVVENLPTLDTSGSYSLAEMLTPARWIDGKKIYKRTFICEITKQETYTDAGTIDDYADVVNITGVAIVGSGNYVAIDSYYSDSYSRFVRVTYEGVVQGYVRGSADAGNPVFMYITVYYTKFANQKDPN